MIQESRRTGWLGLIRAPFFSPAGFLARAGIISIAFLFCHALGLRVYTSILSGTSPTGGAAVDWFGVVLAFTYMLLYFAFVLGVPILILASGLLAALQSVLTDRKGLRRDQAW